jgi:putative ABC transport system permease protein
VKASPPWRAQRLLARVLRDDPAGLSILGDVHEDFTAIARRRGAAAARWWYRREVALLAAGRLWHGLLSSFREPGTMRQLFSRGGLAQDGASALRTIGRSPALFVLLALMIAIGVGATTTVYSVLRPLLLAPLPFEDPDALVWIGNEGERESLSTVTSRSGNLRDFRALSSSFEGLSGYDGFFDKSAYTLLGGGRPEQVLGVAVAHDFLDVLGVTPLLGRGFTVAEGQWGGPPAILLTHGFWRRRFAADPGVVGTTVVVNGAAREVVGVLPPSFDFSSVFSPTVRVDILLPFPVSDETDRKGNTMFFIGRLRPGVTPAAAQAELDRIMEGLLEAQPERWGLGARVEPLQAHIAGPFRPALLLLVGASAAVLLIVCFNVANVLLARSPARGREVAVRKALGATRGRIVRQLLLESLAFAIAGGLAGAGLAVLTSRFVSGMTGVNIPLLDRVTVDGTALAFAFGAAVLAGLFAGLAPALQVAEGRESDTLRAASRGASGHRAGHRLREALVVAELAVACALLVAGGLLLRSFQAVLEVDLGFESADAVAWQLQPSRHFASIDEISGFYAQLTDRARAVPGVESAGLIDALPLGRNRSWGFRRVEAPNEPASWHMPFPHLIDAGYLETMKIPVVAGRGITRYDTSDGPRVLLINETGAAAAFPEGSAVGRRVISVGDEPWEIVGVVADVRHLRPESGPGTQLYFPIAQLWEYETLDLVVRSRLPAQTVAAAVSAALAELDPAMPTHDRWTLEATLDRSLSPRRFTLQILTAFAATALLLAALGIYGVLSQSVAERTREIGIRITLGASAGSVRTAVVGRTLLLAAVGTALGLGSALAGARMLESLLFGVPPTDPATLVTIAGTLLVVSALAGLLPALRASRTDALQVLRGD